MGMFENNISAPAKQLELNLKRTFQKEKKNT